MNVLIAVDSSASDHAALAATLARRWPEGTNFRVLSVIPGRLRDKINSGEISAELFHAHRLLDRATSEIESSNQDSIVVGEIDVGNPTKAILRLADSWPADLIVVGSHDRTLLQRLYMGSVSRAVLHKAHCSVLVARNLAFGPSSCTPLNRVMLAVDGSPYSRAAANLVLTAKWPENTRFHILSVCNPIYSAFAFEPSALRVIGDLERQDEARQQVRSMVDDVALGFENTFGPSNVEYAVTEGQPGEVILATARDWRADLLVVGSHGQPNMAKRLFGSVSQQVAMQADCSVQIVRCSVEQINRFNHQRDESQELQSASGF